VFWLRRRKFFAAGTANRFMKIGNVFPPARYIGLLGDLRVDVRLPNAASPHENK
jgi:hypothetical protein